MRQILSLFLIALVWVAEAKVSLFAHYFGQPEFIKYQHLLFEKNLLDEYEFVVFEDAHDSKTSEKIRKECEKYGITYIHIPRSVFENPKLPINDWYISLGAPSFQCCVATQYIYDHYVIPSNNICLILDNDIFLLSPFSIEQFLEKASFGYVCQLKKEMGAPIHYMLPNFILFNPPLMPDKEKLDFNMGTILGTHTDSGGHTFFYLRDHHSLGKEIPCYHLWNHSTPLKTAFISKCPLLFSSSEWGSHYFLKEETFLHIRMGSNWSLHPKYTQMKKEMEFLFEEILKPTDPLSHSN